MDNKQIVIVRRVLNEHCLELEAMIEEFSDDPDTSNNLKLEKDACDEAIKLISKGCEF